MSMIAVAVKYLLEAGADHETVVRAVAELEALRSPAPETVSAEALRQRRRRERLRADDSVTKRDIVTTVTTCHEPLPSEVSPTPPSYQPSPEPTPFTPLKGGVSPSLIAETSEAIWALQPVVGGKRKCTRPDVAKATKAAVARGGLPGDLLAACRAFYAMPACTEDGGKFAKGAVPLLAEDRWRDFLPGAEQQVPEPEFDGPPQLRAMIANHAGEDFAANYVDPARWNAEGRVLLAKNGFSASKLRSECEAVLRRTKVTVGVLGQTAAIIEQERVA